MKWIGQHIWDLVSRFRSDIYLDKVNSDTNETSPDANLAIKDGKIVRTANSTGGGDVVIIDGSTNYGATSTITIQGDYVQTFDNGDNSVLINISDTDIQTASNFTGFSTNPVDSFSNYRIGTPHDSAGKNFYAGDFAGEYKKATGSTSISFGPSADAQHMQNSKVIVTVYGANATAQDAQLATKTITVTGNVSSTSDGITIEITDYLLDGYGDRRKGKISVTINLDSIASSFATAQSLSNHSGSQKFYNIKVEHKSNDLSTTYGTFNSRDSDADEFFYDGARIQPVTITPTISASNFSTKYLSNIKYYSSISWEFSGSNIQNISRDTRGYANNNSNDVKLIFTHPLSNDNDGKKWMGINGNTNNSVNDDSNSFSWNVSLNSNQYSLSKQAVGEIDIIYGGLAGNVYPDSTATDSARAINSHAATSQANTTDNFRSESHRLPHHNVTTWNVTNITQAQLETYAGTDNLDGDERDLLVQTKHNGNYYKLIHPYNLSTPAALPTQDRWSGHATPAQNDYVYYYRYFEYGSGTSSLTFKMDGVNRTTYTNAYNADTLKVHFSRPTSGDGSNNTWIPIRTDADFTTGAPSRSCFYGTQPTDDSRFYIQFDTQVTTVVVRIGMKATFATPIYGLHLTENHS